MTTATPAPADILKAIATLGLNDEVVVAAPILALFFGWLAKNPTPNLPALMMEIGSIEAQLLAGQTGVAAVAAGQVNTWAQAVLAAVVTKLAGDAAAAQATLAALMPAAAPPPPLKRLLWQSRFSDIRPRSLPAISTCVTSPSLRMMTAMSSSMSAIRAVS